MPLDNRFNNDLFEERVLWTLKFAWLPHRCELSGRLVWLEDAYYGVASWTGPGEPVIEKRWRNPNQHLLRLLKK